jgi:uncharacterized protein involved in exopolysaccharide biosynthesis
MKLDEIHEQVSESPAPDPPAESRQLLDVLIILARRKKFVMGFTLGAALLAVVIVLMVPSKYTATTLVLPPVQTSSMSSALLGQLGGSSALASVAGASLGIRNPADMYVSLFRSRTVEDTMIRRFGLMARYRRKRMSDTRTAFEARSTVALGIKDGLLRITVTDWDPNLAAEMANAYVDEFRNISANLAITEASQRRIFFEKQLLEANQNLTVAEEAMKRTEQSTGVLQVDSQARSLIESAATLRGQVVAKEVQLQAMRSYATEDNPEIVVVEQQLAALKAQLAKLGGTDANSSSDIIVPKGNIPQAGMEYIRKLRDVKYYETIAQLIARQFEVAKLDEARQGAIIQVADAAVPPDKRSSPHRTIVVVLTTFIAFVVAALWALASARWQETLRDAEKRNKVQTLRGLLWNRQR